MNEFIEKWKTDPRYKTKIKLGVSTLFVVLVSIFAFATRQPVSTDIVDNSAKQEEKTKINIPDEYVYTIKITINEKEYLYNGTKKQEQETIAKTVDDTTTNYIFEKDTYYKDSIGLSNITTKEEVYDILNYNYIDLETINKYLSVSTKKDNQYLVYLKDIVLGSDSQEYITITKEEDKINIDYTSLMNQFDKTIDNYTVEFVIEEKE